MMPWGWNSLPYRKEIPVNLKLMLVNEDGESEGEYDLTGCDLSKSFRQAEVIDWLRAAMEAAAYRAKQRQEES